ncbi:MAG TPA: non-ribosomal peptide synthetase, partial [Thermoanaerobaculia bacterium]|nr:non-ribosomal peptide synthetase [Thermoanaerobaculia bacterium]
FRAAVRDGVTGLEVVPAVLSAVLDAPPDTVPAAYPDLRWLMVTGEATSPELVNRWLGRHPDLPLVNAYGPAECSDDTTLAFLRRTLDPEKVERTPIGQPVANLAMYVTDRHLRPVPLGAPGELICGGAGVGRGYLADPRRTAESFVPDPFAAGPGARAYRTGDLARWRADGQLEFLGRVDHQVKIRGFRIEPGEVEAVTRQHPGVRDCAVICREDTPGNRRLVAYVVAAGPEPVDLGDLRRAAREKLPDYMVPSAYVPLPELPRNAHGKVDRRALPAPDSDRPLLGSAYVAPRTEVETALAAIWSDVLGLTRVGIEDDFFEVGGHSLLLTQVAARINDAFGVDVPLRELFQRSTIAELARALEALRWAAGAPAPAGEAAEDEEEGVL